MIDFSKDVLWIFSCKNPISIPSYVVGGIMPADFLKIQKIIFLENHDPNEVLSNLKPKIIIIGKAFHQGVYELVKIANILNIKVISIFDDWHFEDSNNEIKKRSKLNSDISKISSEIVVKTKSASKIIQENLNLDPKIIPDCLRYKTLYNKDFFEYPFNIAWFGNYTNHKTIVKGLNEISKFNYKVKLQIITNKIDIIKIRLNNYNENIDISFVDWSFNLHEYIQNSDIVIIPLFDNNKSRVKSSNRIVDALNMGRFVIINENYQFKEFKEFCYFGNIGEGLNWLKNNKEEAKKMIDSGQKYVLENYSLNKITDKWKVLLKKI